MTSPERPAEDVDAMDLALLLAGEPEAVAAFAKETGLSVEFVMSLLHIRSIANGSSLTMAKLPTTIQ